jgi:glycosyltransferase involved in cell wall biosynthesis
MNRFVVLAPNRWDSMWTNRQQMFSRLARRHFVLYSTGALNLRRWRGAGRPSGPGDVGRPGAVLVDEPPLLLWRVPRVAPWDRFVIRRTARRWRRLAGPRDAGPLTAYVFHPKFWPYIYDLDPDHVVYHAYDLFERSRGWSERLDRFQRFLCQKADLVVSSSQTIADVLESKYGRAPTVIANGVDYDAFVSAADRGGPEPAELQAIPRPRIGYTGGISRKLDFELITTLARRRRQWHFVLMGEVRSLDGASSALMAEAQAQPNIHFLAPKPHESVPAYVCAMDVNIMCYRLSDDLWIEGIYPLKLHEYLAAGRPIVSADVPSVRPFAHVVTIARGADQWERALESALSNEKPESVAGRRQVAAENSWAARVDQLEAELSALASRAKSEREQGLRPLGI